MVDRVPLQSTVADPAGASAFRYNDVRGNSRCILCHCRVCDGGEVCAYIASRRHLSVSTAFGCDGFCYLDLLRLDLYVASVEALQRNPTVARVRAYTNSLVRPFTDSLLSAHVDTAYVNGQARVCVHVSPGALSARTLLQSFSKGLTFA